MRGHDCIKIWCFEANLESPEVITSAKLRKYVATVCQNTVELTKVRRLLLAVDQGKAHTFAGKSLEDIEVKGEANYVYNVEVLGLLLPSSVLLEFVVCWSLLPTFFQHEWLACSETGNSITTTT
nr:unnamed protein product [Callosobruchus chinensis]